MPEPKDTLKLAGQSGYGVARGNLIPSKNQKGKKESDEEMKSKMTSLFSVLMIALIASGISYAMWSKTLYINGTVHTGYLDARFSNCASSDPPTLGSLDTINTTSWTYNAITDTFTWTGSTYDKDVANTTCTITTTTNTNDTLVVTMNVTFTAAQYNEAPP